MKWEQFWNNSFELFFLQFEQMLRLAQRSADELFSIALYNWLIQADLADKLLQVRSCKINLFKQYFVVCFPLTKQVDCSSTG